jgi:hypothetical protein
MAKFIIEDAYEPIEFGIKNKEGEIFECQTLFRTTEENIKIEKLMRDPIPHFDKNDNLINEDEMNKTKNERLIKAIVIMAGKDEVFWKQFSNNALSRVLDYIRDSEEEKYKKKQGKK